THSSIKPPVLRWPLDDCLAAKISIVEPFLNTYLTLSFDFVDTPRSQLISLFKPGISLQISSILAIVIDAACSFSFVTLRIFYPLVLILLYSYKLSISFHPRHIVRFDCW
ncbi:MAG: hypothetical protein J6O41_05620, partial [Clostridia bacterium]|nr:hypothetical protein [Clostridia bacterium]